MNADWQRFLESAGGQVPAAGSAHFATFEPAILERCAICDLSRYASLAVDGADAESFLQGQLSNDIESLADDGAQISAYCNPKGRVIAVVRLVRQDDGFIMLLPGSVAQMVLERLRRYVLRSKVNIEYAPDLASFGVIGGDDGKLGVVCGPLPATTDRVSRSDGLQVIRHRSATQPRYQLIGTTRRLATAWTALAPTSTVVSDDLWRWFDIRAGMPEIEAATGELFIPQMINLDLVNGISFKKGCYPGQEIVARMRYLGKLKQRMFLGHLDSAAAPAAADQILDPASHQKVGQVVSAQFSPAGGVDVLAVLRIEAAGAPLTVDTGDPLKILSLPYALDSDVQT